MADWSSKELSDVLDNSRYVFILFAVMSILPVLVIMVSFSGIGSGSGEGLGLIGGILFPVLYLLMPFILCVVNIFMISVQKSWFFTACEMLLLLACAVYFYHSIVFWPLIIAGIYLGFLSRVALLLSEKNNY
jgi:hypothetical protein